MTTAMQLTDEPDWQDKYEITLYQLGWRLGGKGASGRNRDIANRIEEHGLHLWFGFYDNAFDLIQRVYKANDRPLTKPLATWQEAFKPYGLFVLMEYVYGDWQYWPIQFPLNDQVPGLSGPPPTIWEMLREFLATLFDQHIQYFKKKESEGKKPSASPAPAHHPGLLEKIGDFFKKHGSAPSPEDHNSFLSGLESWFSGEEKEVEAVAIDFGASLIYAAMQFMNSVVDHNETHHNILLNFIDKILQRTWSKVEYEIDEDPETRRLWIETDFALSMARGILLDGVITQGFDVINDMDFREWMKKNGCSEMTLDSCLVQAVYIIAFGGYKYFTFEAGTALRGVLRMGLTYNGALYYRMQAGMGDTIFGPMYEVLKKRGVKFEFFHKVKNLKLSEDKKNIESVEMGIQATSKNGIEYSPMFDVKGLPCWPSHPDYDQLEQGQQLKEQHINLESYWTPWQDVGQKTIRYGIDYDILVQGISIGALPVIAKEILDTNEKWKVMVDTVTACETQAFQLWQYPDIAGLGWPYWTGDLPISGCYIEPFDTWADMSDLIIRESWPDDAFPNNIAYMCGPIMDRVDYSKWDFNDHDVPQKAYDAVVDGTQKFLEEHVGKLWPNTIDENGNFKWELLVDLKNGKNEERFKSQWFKANIDPSELYVLSVTNSTKNRLKTNESGYDNMFITGDWIFTGLNCGCVEAAVIAGKQTARAILKQDFEIYGEIDHV